MQVGKHTHTWRCTLVGELAASPTHPEAKNTLCALHVHTHTRPYLFHRPPLRPLMPPCWAASPNHYTDAKKSCDSRRAAFIACASLTAWSYKWPSRSRFWWACVHWGTDDAHHAGPGLDPCHEGRTHLWVNSAHPCPDTVNFTWKKTKQNSMSPFIHPTPRPCALHRAFSSKSFVLQPNWLKDATYGTYSVKWVLGVPVSLLLVVIPSSLFTSTAQRKSTLHQSTGGLIMHCSGKCDIYKEDWCE